MYTHLFKKKRYKYVTLMRNRYTLNIPLTSLCKMFLASVEIGAIIRYSLVINIGYFSLKLISSFLQKLNKFR